MTILAIVACVLWASLAMNFSWSGAKTSFADAYRSEVQRCIERPETKADLPRCLDLSAEAVPSIERTFLSTLPATLAVALAPVALLLMALVMVRRRPSGGRAA
jgi:hypothetical protein